MLVVPSAHAEIKKAANFADSTVFTGLSEPTNVRFAPNGEVFVINKGGHIYDYPNLAEPTRQVEVADLSEEVMDYEDRGMLGLAVDPQYPAKPYIYVLYAYDAPPGRPAPVWPHTGCPTPPGPGPEFGVEGGDGCVITGRLSRIAIDPTTHKGVEEPLIENDWCQQFTSHSIGDLEFGPEGALYVSGGAGGAFNLADWGQFGGTRQNEKHEVVVPNNPCGDPNELSGPGPGTPGVTKEELPTAESGVLRSQSFRRPEEQPAVLGGTIVRVNPENGEPFAGNPNISRSGMDRKRIVAYGLRQPFRFTFRPGTKELWVGDVGENTWEEIDRDKNPLATPTANFGWPCFEGNDFPYEYGLAYEQAELCKKLYSPGEPEEHTAIGPYYAYQHGEAVVEGDGCPYREVSPESGSSISGVAFLNRTGGPWPAEWRGALFFGDVTRDCIWAMMPPASEQGGLPEPKARRMIESSSEGHGVVCEFEARPTTCPVDLELGPEGDIYYVDIAGGSIRRLSYDTYPVAVLGASAGRGVAPLHVTFTGASSSSPDPGLTTYHWELGDGAGSNEANASHTYAEPGVYAAKLTVTDSKTGTEDTSSIKVTVVAESPQEQQEHREAKERQEQKERQEREQRESQGTGTTVVSTNPLSTPMTLTGLSLKPTSFVAAPTASLRKPSGHGRSAIGAKLSLILSQAAIVKLSFARRVGGRYRSVAARGVVSTCTLGPPRGPAHRRTRKCRSPRSNSISFAGRAGTNTLTLSGWVGGLALPAGSYQLTPQAFAPDMTVSEPASARFTIVAPPRRR